MVVDLPREPKDPAVILMSGLSTGIMNISDNFHKALQIEKPPFAGDLQEANANFLNSLEDISPIAKFATEGFALPPPPWSDEEEITLPFIPNNASVTVTGNDDDLPFPLPKLPEGLLFAENINKMFSDMAHGIQGVFGALFPFAKKDGNDFELPGFNLGGRKKTFVPSPSVQKMSKSRISGEKVVPKVPARPKADPTPYGEIKTPELRDLPY